MADRSGSRLGATAIEVLTSQIVGVVGLRGPTAMTAPPSVLEHLAAIATTLQAGLGTPNGASDIAPTISRLASP